MLNRPRFVVWIATLIVGCGSASLARASEFDQASLAKIRPAMQKFVDEKQIAGAVTVVGSSSGVASIEAIGNALIEGPHAMRPDSLFRIASMTKPITAMAIMALQEDGKLSVEDSVEQHLPEFKGQMLVSSKADGLVTLKKPARVITIRDLLTHTSGLPGGFPAGLADLYNRRHLTLTEAVLVSSQQPLDFEPGSKWSYCNAGIDTLGRIVEVASGKSFEAFLVERFFSPLGMHDTRCFLDESQRGRVAGLYERKGDELVVTVRPLVGPSQGAKHPIPAGGLLSTGPDLGKLYTAMLRKGEFGGKRVLSEQSHKTMTAVQTGELPTGFVPGMSFGFGWAVVRQPMGVTESASVGTYGHGGAFGTQAWIDPQKDVFVVLLIQRAGLPNADGSDIRKSLQDLATKALKP